MHVPVPHGDGGATVPLLRAEHRHCQLHHVLRQSGMSELTCTRCGRSLHGDDYLHCRVTVGDILFLICKRCRVDVMDFLTGKPASREESGR